MFLVKGGYFVFFISSLKVSSSFFLSMPISSARRFVCFRYVRKRLCRISVFSSSVSSSSASSSANHRPRVVSWYVFIHVTRLSVSFFSMLSFRTPRVVRVFRFSITVLFE